MRKLLTPVVLVASVGLGGAVYPTAQTDFEWTGQLAAGQSIEIRGINGAIHASAAPGGNILVTAVKTARRSNPSDVRIEAVATARGVLVCAIYPAPAGEPANECKPDSRGGRSNTRNNDTVVDFTVQVPAGIGLVASTVNGSIDANGLKSDVTGTTVNGSVDVTTSGSARATTVNGSIHADMDRAVWPNGARFTTVNGEVTLRLPAAVNADVRLSTVNGGIKSDFPVTIGNEPGPKHAEGVFGAGGQRLDVTTVNGGISLLRR